MYYILYIYILLCFISILIWVQDYTVSDTLFTLQAIYMYIIFYYFFPQITLSSVGFLQVRLGGCALKHWYKQPQALLFLSRYQLLSTKLTRLQKYSNVTSSVFCLPLHFYFFQKPCNQSVVYLPPVLTGILQVAGLKSQLLTPIFRCQQYKCEVSV